MSPAEIFFNLICNFHHNVQKNFTKTRYVTLLTFVSQLQNREIVILELKRLPTFYENLEIPTLWTLALKWYTNTITLIAMTIVLMVFYPFPTTMPPVQQKLRKHVRTLLNTVPYVWWSSTYPKRHQNFLSALRKWTFIFLALKITPIYKFFQWVNYF